MSNPGGWWARTLRSPRWTSMLVVVVPKGVAVAAAAPVAVAWAAKSWQWAWAALAVVLYLLAFTVEALAKKAEAARAEDRETTVADMRSTTIRELCDGLTGLPTGAGSFFALVQSADGDLQRHLDHYFDVVLAALVRLISAPGARVCLYMAEESESSRSDDRPTDAPTVDALVLRGVGHGRPDHPRPGFDRSTSHGRCVINALTSRTSLRVADTQNPPSSVDIDCDDKEYSCFVAVPVVSEIRPCGMLMLDATEVGGITRDHEYVAHLAGRFLASAYQFADLTPVSRPSSSVSPASVRMSIDGGTP